MPGATTPGEGNRPSIVFADNDALILEAISELL